MIWGYPYFRKHPCNDPDGDWNPGQGGCNPSYNTPEKLTAGYLKNDGFEKDVPPASNMAIFFG